MKYLLVIPPNKGTDFPYMPLGLPYVAGAMRAHGLDIVSVNLTFAESYVDDASDESKGYIEILKEIISSNSIDAILCGGLSVEYDSLKEIFETAKKVNPSIITIGGGGGFTSEPILFSEMLDVDYAVIGEGEITNCLLADALNKGESADEISGLVIKKDDGEYVFTGNREPIKDVDSIPFPSYEGFGIETFLNRQGTVGNNRSQCYLDDPRIMPMLMSRSCPFMCSFCFHPIGRGYRTRSLDNFFEEVDQYVEKYQINGIALADECFSVNPDRVREFCKRIKPYNLIWECQMRVETYSEELLKIMVDSGCRFASFGVENVSQRNLDDMNKKTSVQQLKQTLESAYSVGVGSGGNILFGTEAETPETIRENMYWIQNNNYCKVFNIAMIAAYPGSKYYEKAVKVGIIKDRKEFIKNGCDIVNLTSMPYVDFLLMRMLVNIQNSYLRHIGNVVSYIKTGDTYMVDLKCAHCGYINHIPNIPPKIVSTGIIKNMGCRKCRNFSDYTFHTQNWIPPFVNTISWIESRLYDRKESTIVKDWISKHNYRKIAIYGMTYKDVIEGELEDIEFFGIDKYPNKFQGSAHQVYGLEDNLPEFQIIIVLIVYHFDLIKSSLVKFGVAEERIVSLDTILGDGGYENMQ